MNQSILSQLGFNESRKRENIYNDFRGTKLKNKTFFAMTLVNSKNNYVNFATPKVQPEMARMSFPYFL